MSGTIRIEDMRLFAKVAEAKSFTGAARMLGVPKQTLSRRVAELACADDLRRKRLVPVLGACLVDVGAIWLLYPARRFVPARLRAFVDLAQERFTSSPPWLPKKVVVERNRSHARKPRKG
jgi:DNA-binding transcriptional LysR family regulator